MTIEVLATSVVDRGRSRVGVAGRDLHVTKANAGVEGSHDDRGAQQDRAFTPPVDGDGAFRAWNERDGRRARRR